ncbi:uncharacterized protein LOC129179978 [Dunckerocampus dactyliophorus]|uniref:uncharacterized protein LOC129179978 n=1 Tax=Dunckerocampus dactyliophorus TaxID=161453 RepID=UPI0024071877|nr:uncharacterized protein LOC129179978 [Dunckerocampus dactyliophorus]
MESEEQQQPVGAESIEYSLLPESSAVEEDALRSTQNTSSWMTAVYRGVWCLTGFLILSGCVAAGFFVMNSKLDQVKSRLNATEEVQRRLNTSLTQHDDLMKKYRDQMLMLKTERDTVLKEQQRMKDRINGLKPQQSKLQGQYDKAKTEMNSLKNCCLDIQSLQLQGTVKGLQKQIDVNVERCNTLAEDLQTLTQGRVNLQQQQQDFLDAEKTLKGLVRGIACNNTMASRFNCTRKKFDV